MWQTPRGALLGVLMCSLGASASESQTPAPGGAANPPFKWEEGYATPGTTLSVKEGTRLKARVDYKLKAEGFDNTHGLLLWFRRGSRYGSVRAELAKQGFVRLDPADLQHLKDSVGPVYIDPTESALGKPVIGGRTLGTPVSEDFSIRGIFSRGESLDVALWDPVDGTRAQARVIPFPVASTGKGGCSATAEQVERDPLTFSLTFAGFLPGSTVKVSRPSKGSRRENSFVASERGEVMLRLQVAPGNVEVQATDGNCTVGLDFVPGPPRL
jgi:hypothetical protein